MELACGKDKENLKSWINNRNFDPHQKVKEVTEIYNKYNIKEVTESKMNKYFDEGINQIKMLHGREKNKTLLNNFFVQLISRER